MQSLWGTSRKALHGVVTACFSAALLQRDTASEVRYQSANCANCENTVFALWRGRMCTAFVMREHIFNRESTFQRPLLQRDTASEIRILHRENTCFVERIHSTWTERMLSNENSFKELFYYGTLLRALNRRQILKSTLYIVKYLWIYQGTDFWE